MFESLIVAIFLANSSAPYSLQKITFLIPVALCASVVFQINIVLDEIFELISSIFSVINKSNVNGYAEIHRVLFILNKYEDII